jgi:hypothetical protein
MSIDAEEAAIRTVIVGALMGHSDAGERGFDSLVAMRQAEAIVKRSAGTCRVRLATDVDQRLDGEAAVAGRRRAKRRHLLGAVHGVPGRKLAFDSGSRGPLLTGGTTDPPGCLETPAPEGGLRCQA